MNKVKQVTATIVLIILAVILFGVYATSAFNKVDVTLGEIQNMMRNQSEDLWNYDPNDLMYTYGGNYSMIRDGDAWKYSGNPNTSCLSENGHEWGTLMAKLRAVIDIDSDGTVYIYSDNYNGYANADDVERFNQLACICELQSTRSASATNYPSFFFSDIAARNPEYGIDTFQPGTREDYARYANGALVEAQKEWGALPANNRIRDGYRMRILIVSYKNPSGENAGQERMFFGEAPYDDEPQPGKLRLIKANSKTDERIPGIQFRIKRTGNNKAETGYIQVIGKFGKNDVIPGSPTPESSSSSATDNAEASASSGDIEYVPGVNTAPYPGEPGKVYLMNSDSDSNDQKEDRAIPGPITGVGQESDWRIVYTSIEKDATIFETDSNGEIYISGLMSGDYVAEELEGEMSEAFEIVPETTTFKVKKCPDGDVTKGEDSKAIIKNEPITVTVELDKTDMISGQALNGAGFKLQNTDTGEWVTDPYAKKPQDKLSKDEASAYEFSTENGKISVPGLPPGNYKWIETTFPTNERTGGKYVALDRDAGGFSVSGGKGETVSVNAQNKPVGLFRKVIKGTDKGIQGVPFEFREYNIKEEYMSVYPELWTNQEYYHGESLGGTPCCETGQHCEIYLCDCVDEPVLVSPATKYRPAIYKCSKHGQTGYYAAVKSHCDEWMKKRDERNDLAKKVNEIHRARENGRDEINTGTKSEGSGSNNENSSSSSNSSSNSTATASTSSTPSENTKPDEGTTPSENTKPGEGTTPSESTSPSANPEDKTSKIKSLLESVCPELFDENGEFYAGITDTGINECTRTDTILSDVNLNWICLQHSNHGTYEELTQHIQEWNKERDEHNRLVRLANKIYAAKEEGKGYTIKEIVEEIYPELFKGELYKGETDTEINKYRTDDNVLQSGFVDGRENYFFCIEHHYKGTHDGLVIHIQEWNKTKNEHDNLIEKINKLYSTIAEQLKTGNSGTENKNTIRAAFKMICSELFMGEFYVGETDSTINEYHYNDGIITDINGKAQCARHGYSGTQEEMAEHVMEWDNAVQQHNKLVKLVNKTYAAMQEGKKYSIKELCKEIYPELFTGEYYAGETDSMIKLCYTNDTTRVYSDTDTTCTRHDHHTTKEKATQHVNDWNRERDQRNNIVEKLNNLYKAVYGSDDSDSKKTTSRATSVDGVREVTQVAAASNEGSGTSTGGKRNNLTDENGDIDISPLVPDGDDGHGKFQYREIDEGMENPYFNNDHPDWTDFDYLGKTIVEDERRRMDIEGLIWVEKSQDQKGGVDDPETVNGIYDEGLDQLLYPVEVCLKHNDQVIGQGVITTDGRYRIRVGGRDGADIKYVTTEKEGTYVEFTYNGMKYQSVWPATLENEENGSKAVEKAEDRQAFNERYKTIISNNGDAMSNKVADGTIINYEKLDVNGPYSYKRRVLYEGKVEGLFDGAESETFGGRDSDPIGDGVYGGLQKRPKANEVDGEPNTMQQVTNGDTSIYSDNVYTYSSKTGGDKYQIKADTQTAGYQGIMNYKVEDDKIEHVNLGVYERTQPDIALVNDIERVVTHINNEQYLYQYGANTQADKDFLNANDGKGDLQGRFQSNVNYKYKRYLRPEQIQVDQTIQNNHEQDPFVMTIYYRTEVINQSNYVYLQPEIRTQYDSKYQTEVRDATQEVVQDKASRSGENETSMAATMANEVWQSSSPSGGTNANIPSGYQEAYNTLTGDPIAPGQSKVFYTAYTLRRENLKDLVYATKEMYFFNNIEVNAYTTTWHDDKGQERLVNADGAYAGIDIDSAAGNSVPTTNYGQQEDGSWAPADADPTETFEDDNDIAPVFELKYETPAKISGTVYLDDIVKDGENYPTAKSVDDTDRDAGTVQDYIGNGIREDGEVPVKDVKVELVELDESGNEILDNGNTMVRLLEKDTSHDPLSTETFAVTKTEEDGTYSFEGFIPGEYIVKFTWGQHVTYIDPNKPDEGEKTLTSTTQNGDIAYVQQYKSTVFNDEARYTQMTDMKGDTTTRNRWYIDGSNVEYSGKSNAIDDMEMRRKIDSQILNTGNNYSNDGTSADNENILTYPDLEEEQVFKDRETSIVSRTPAFDVSEQENEYTTTQDKDEVEQKNKDIDRDYVEINLDGVDFGISERPKQNMELEKRIQRVSVKLANGQTLIDANVLWDEEKGNTREQRMKIKDITGEIKQVAYPKDTVQDGDIGTFKMEVDKEILQGSTMEITYKYNIINESYLDYNLAKDEDNKELPYEFHDKAHLNRYYKYGNGYVAPIEEGEVEMSPSIIVDYLDNAMGWKKYDEVDYHENDLWEEITEDENKNSQRVTDLLYDGRFTDGNNKLYEKNKALYNRYETASIKAQVDNIYKFYRTILRDTTKQNLAKLTDEGIGEEQINKSQIYLKAKAISYDDVKFVASKELSDTNVDLNFYNVAEIAQINRTGGAIPEEIIPGDNDPTNTGHTDTKNNNFESSTKQTYTVEHDGGWASLVTITSPTGDSTNYNFMVWTAVGIVALAILGIGTLGIKKVLVPSKTIELKEDPKEDK